MRSLALRFVAAVVVIPVVPVMVQINMPWTMSRTGCQTRRCDVQA